MRNKTNERERTNDELTQPPPVRMTVAVAAFAVVVVDL